MPYIPNDWYMICQRTGMKFRRSEMREERTGIDNLKSLWVHKDFVDPVHPQEYVKVEPEDPSVYPTMEDVTQTSGSTVLEGNFYPDQKKIIITNGSQIAADDPIGIVADNDTTHWTFVTDIEDTTIPLIDADGEIVYDANGEIVYAAESDGYTVTLHTGLIYKSSLGNTVILPSINNETWI